MPDWVKEHLGEILVLIYIFYPMLKRWWDRRKEKREQGPEPRQRQRQSRRQRQRQRQEQSERQRQSQRQRQRQSQRQEQPQADRDRVPDRDPAFAARERANALRDRGTKLLRRAERDRRLARLVPALREDLLGRITGVERSLSGSPTLSTILQESAALDALEELLRYLSMMAQQRSYGRSTMLADADAVADACYAPILELARVQGLQLRTSQPVAVTGDWTLSIVPRFASTRVAPLRVPAGFDRSLWLWPAIAHEVAHDLFYSLETIDRELYARLGLPRSVDVPASEADLDPGWLRRLFGAWLPEVFADVLGTIMLGPAYVETMRRAFRNPSSPQRTAAILQDGGRIDTHPPERLRVYMGTRALHYLGRHQEADEIWEHWEADHPGVGFYFLPLGGEWVGLSDEALHGVADSMVETLIQRPWPELDGFQLLKIPGLAYLQAEHAEVERLLDPLASGEPVDADARWVTAAAVLAAKAQPTLHDTILDAARKSIEVAGEEPTQATAALSAHRPSESIPAALVASLRRPDAIREAIILSAALGSRARTLKPEAFRPPKPPTA